MISDVPLLIVTQDAQRGGVIASLLPGTSKQACIGAVAALQHLETHAAMVLIIDADMDDMTGVELADAVREIEREDTTHDRVLAYTLLIGVGPPPDNLHTLFGETIDAWIDEHQLAAHLPPAVAAAASIAARTNTLRSENLTLAARNAELQAGQLIDFTTGLGNERLAMQRLNDSIRQIESRGGAVCFLLIGVMNLDAIRTRYDQRIADELVNAVSARIRQLVRPLDAVTYFGPGRFGLILNQPSIEQCTAACYQRIHDGVRLKSYKTAVGYIDIQLGMSLCASEAETGPPSAETITRVSAENLESAFHNETIAVHHLTSR